MVSKQHDLPDRGLSPAEFRSPEAAIVSMFGESPEAEELEWYARLRDGVRLARLDADLSQVELAHRLGVRQSEISRLENSLNFGTRLGKIREHLIASGAQFLTQIVTKAGRIIGAGHDLPRDEGHGPSITVDEVVFHEPDLPYLALVLPALDGAMMDLGFNAHDAYQLRQRFLQRLQGRSHLWMPPVPPTPTVSTPIDMVGV